MPKYPNDRQLKLKTEPGRYTAERNLYLVVGKGGARSWSLIYTSPVTGKRREYGLGSAEVVTLAEARDKADELRLDIKKGSDPIEDKKTKKSRAKADATTFGTYVEAWITGQETRKENPLRAGTIRNMRGALKNLPGTFTDKKIASITSEHVIAELRPIWRKAPNVGVLVQKIMENVLDAARAEKLREGENPARWKGNLETMKHAFPRPKHDTHHAAMPYADIPEWFAANDFDAAKFLALTVARSSEARLAQWSEFDLDAKLWTIPPERMKSRRQHRVPLSDAALAILERTARTRSPFVFNGGKTGQATLLKKIGRPGITAHGFRSSFRDWAFEETDHSREIIEMSLAHAVGDATERAYRRGDALEKRRALLRDWAAFVISKTAD
jgi:integrase